MRHPECKRRRRDAMKRTLREWRTLWEDWDINDYAELDALFTESDIEEYWDNLCEVDIILTTTEGRITEALIKLFEPEEGIILVQYEYTVPFQMGRPELIDMIETLNQDEEDEEESALEQKKNDPTT